MSVLQSNLSSTNQSTDPWNHVDFIVAVTQGSVNVTLEQFLDGVEAKETIACCIFDGAGNIVPIDYGSLCSAANGSDPFGIADASDPSTNPDLAKLSDARFAGAVKFTVGLPKDVPLPNVPPVVVLKGGNILQFSMLCFTLQIVGFISTPSGRRWINQSQPTGTEDLWYFSSDVRLDMGTTDPGSPMPGPVQQHIDDLKQSGQDTFTVQSLILDLDATVPSSIPAVSGLVPGMSMNVPDLGQIVFDVFRMAYFAELKALGSPVLGYTFLVPSPQPATLQVTSMVPCSFPYHDDGEGDISDPTPAQADAATLVFFGTQSLTPPFPYRYPWNWVELAESTQISGVQVIRRDLFFTYLAVAISDGLSDFVLCPSLSLVSKPVHSGPALEYELSVNATTKVGGPLMFELNQTIDPPGPDGFTKVCSAYWSGRSQDKNRLGTGWAQVGIDCIYYGALLANGKVFRVTVQSIASMDITLSDLNGSYPNLPAANYVDLTRTMDFTLSTGDYGELQVSEVSSVQDRSVPWPFSESQYLSYPFSLFTAGLDKSMQQLKDGIATAMNGNMTSSDNIENTIDKTKGWIFIGSEAFTFGNVSFSSGLDLTAQLQYVEPS